MSNNNTPSPDQRLTPPIKDNNTPTVSDTNDGLIMIYRISYIILLILVFLYPKLSKNIIYKIVLGIDLLIVGIPIAILIIFTLCVCSLMFFITKNDTNTTTVTFTSTMLLFQSIIIGVGLGVPILTYLFSKNIVFPNIDSVSNSTLLSTTDSASSS
jgi:hypothetical protein